MSVGQTEPVSKGEMTQFVVPPLNQNVDTNHHRDINSNSNDIRYRTSFKSTKPKQSKIRHLTYSELRGIFLATILSFVISGLLLYSLFSLSPIALRHGLNVLQLFSNYISENYNDNSNNNNHNNNDATMKQQQDLKKLSRYMGVKKDMNCSIFNEYYLQKYPVVFLSDNRLGVHAEILDLLMNRDNADIAVELKLVEELLGFSQYFNLTDESSNAFVLTLDEYYRFELSMNDDIVDRNYYYSNATLISSLIHRNNINADRTTTTIFPPELSVSSSLSSPSRIKCSSKDNVFKKFTNHIVSIGRNISHLSGMGFHIHKQRLNELLYGQKHWIFYKPVNIPSTGFHPQENLHDWLRDIYPSLTMNDAQPIEILQNAGDIVYVPEGWYHATRTISDLSISISYEPSEEEYGTYYYYLTQGNKKANAKDFKSAIKLYRLGLAIEADVNILQKLAYSYEQEGLLIDAEETYLQAIQRNPRDPYTYALLINLLITHNPKDATSNITDLLHRGETYGLKPSILKLIQIIL